MIRLRTAAALILAIAAVFAAPTAANATAATDLQLRVDAAMEEFPGGTQTADDTIEWKDGATTMTLPGGSSARSIGTCATGAYCAWSGSGYSGTKLSFTTCSAAGTSSSLTSLALVRSIANARTSGTVQYRNGGTTVYSLPANTGNSATSGTLTVAVCFT